MNFDSDYSVRLATLGALGGDTTKCYDSVYEIDLAILDIIQHGGGGGGAAIDDNNVSTGTTWSSSKIVSELADAGFDVEIVTELPTTGDAHTIYFIESSSSQTGNIYDEWMYINNNWEQVGSTAVDLSNYYTKSQTDTLLANKPDIVEITQAEYDALPTASKNNGSIYSITDAVVVDPANYYTKTEADAAFNPYNTVTARTSNYYLPKWNARGQITGETRVYQSSFNINGTSKTVYTTATGNLTDIYAPTAAGTAGQYLVSSGSGAPTWQALEVASDYVISDADASAGTYSTDIAAFYNKTISENVVQGVQIKMTDEHNSYEVSTNTIGAGMTDGTIFAIPTGEGATLEFSIITRAGEQSYTLTINSDGTITDPDSTDLITASTVSITGYNVYDYTAQEGYGTDYLQVTGNVYLVDVETTTSDSYYLPSSSRIYSGNVELWLMTTEDGATWQNNHYLITNSSISRDISTGTFGPVNQ